MYYKIKVLDHVRLPPTLYGGNTKEAITKAIKKIYSGFISKELGIVIDVTSVDDIKDGIIIPEDGATYYETEFTLLTFQPELQEIVVGKIKDITDFGAFLSLGPIEGMIHISQAINDFVSFSKDKQLLGKDTHRSLKVNDDCNGKIIAVSYKDVNNPKIGITMRQEGLGKKEWIIEDLTNPKKTKKK
jgi:DNA-directed RNA polymerase subunit E'